MDITFIFNVEKTSLWRWLATLIQRHFAQWDCMYWDARALCGFHKVLFRDMMHETHNMAFCAAFTLSSVVYCLQCSVKGDRHEHTSSVWSPFMIYSANKKICLPGFVQMVHNEGYVSANTLILEVPITFINIKLTNCSGSPLTLKCSWPLTFEALHHYDMKNQYWY